MWCERTLNGQVMLLLVLGRYSTSFTKVLLNDLGCTESNESDWESGLE